MSNRRLFYTAGLVLQSVFYIAAGVNHFWHSHMYTAIMPPHYDHPLGLVRLSGVAEIMGGMGLLVPATRRVSAWALVAMLVVYFDVHWYMVRNPAHFVSIPAWALYARLPLQFVLIAWAWWYTRLTPDNALRAECI